MSRPEGPGGHKPKDPKPSTPSRTETEKAATASVVGRTRAAAKRGAARDRETLED